MALRGKNFSTFLTTSSQNFTAVFCAHALTESMILFALAIVRIKRWFHFVLHLRLAQTFFCIIRTYSKKVKRQWNFITKANIPIKLFPGSVDIILSTKADFDKFIYSLYTKYRYVNMCLVPVVVFVDKYEKTIDAMPYICYYVFVLKRE